MCYNAGKILQYLTRVPHLAHSPDPSPCVFWLFGYAKEQTKNQTITGEDDVDGALTNVREKVSLSLVQSVFHEWMTRLERVMEAERECHINPH
jgi:hypothetical protein